MSRSRKKYPYVNTACMGRGTMKKWKIQCNDIIRLTEEVPNGNSYKKVTNRWSAPDDGRHWWEDPKGYRK